MPDSGNGSCALEMKELLIKTIKIFKIWKIESTPQYSGSSLVIEVACLAYVWPWVKSPAPQKAGELGTGEWRLAWASF